MTTKKLKILGPYTPDHKGPFCTRDGRPVRILCTDMQNEYSIVAIIIEEDGEEYVNTFLDSGGVSKTRFFDNRDLMNAEEIPKAREFWINEYLREGGLVGITTPHETECAAKRERCELIGWTCLRTIHVREVLPGESA